MQTAKCHPTRVGHQHGYGWPSQSALCYLSRRPAGFYHFDEMKQTLTGTTGLCIKAKHPWLYFGIPPHNDYHGSRWYNRKNRS
ncbi:Peptidase, M28 family (fragment) [Shewanella benthica]|uniref:Peptidase, M28 family n=1 Tax=Shewanella benthica TaxID=43661 RepID=A0A330M6L6_9GAMM